MPQPFKIAVADAVLDDLNQRLRNARFLHALPGSGWKLGADIDFMKRLVDYWLNKYDWRRWEAELNKFPQFIDNVDDLNIHYLHVRSPHKDALPLLITHGWPGSVVEFHKIIGLLTDPVAHGGRAEDAFHVVCPSMPGYGWSDAPAQPGCDIKKVAQYLTGLMDQLGYQRYGAQGGDWGALAGIHAALAAPDSVCGLHLNMLPSSTSEDVAELQEMDVVPGTMSLVSRYVTKGMGYAQIQGTQPDQLGYALNDSPLGLAAWVMTAFNAWVDHSGNVEEVVSFDELLTNMMVYWVTESMPSAIRLYQETMASGRFGLPDAYVATPTGFAHFNDIINPKRAWAERHYNLVHWQEMDKGGHFAALEQPQLLAADMRTFFAPLR